MAISDNPQFIVNGFICFGITGSLDGEKESEHYQYFSSDTNSSDKETDT